MKKITIEIDDAYGRILTISATGGDGRELRVTTAAFDIGKLNRISIDKRGKVWEGVDIGDD